MNCARNFQNKSAWGFSTGGWTLRGIVMMLLLTSTTLVFGQTNQLETDKGIAASIAPYDAVVRQAILEASQHPEILAQLQKSQTQTVDAFQKMISGFNKKKQGWFYTLTRYPDLTHTLATLPAKLHKDAVYKLLPNQDSDLQEAAWKLYKGNKNDLVQVDNIRVSAQQDFEKSIQGLDESTMSAFQKLSELPDVLTLMTNNVELTTKLGEHYKSDPKQLINHLAALHDSLNVQNQYEIAEFKKQMANDPEAQKELSEAAKAYAKSNGYNLPNQQSYVNNPNYYNNPYYSYPYSYWFGYPYWYSSPLWYPGWFGFNSGFYFGLGGFGLYGFPSYSFSNWFYNGGYYNRYPHLYRQFGNYYHSNIAGNRVMGSANRGFMDIAHRHYSPNAGGRLNTLTSPSSFSRSRGASYQRNGGNTTHPNANTYHSQSWGSFGGRGSSPSGGFHSSGGGFHGGGGRGHR